MENTPQELTRHERRQMERAQKEQARLRASKKTRTGKIIWLTVLCGAVVLIGWNIARNKPAQESVDPMAIRTEDRTKGPANATVTLIEYSDYQCPACAAYFPVIKQLQEAFPNDLNIVFRDFPLTQIHNNALAAAYAAEAAGNQGKYWEMHDILFARQGSWASLSNPKDTFTDYARELGLNIDLFTTDMTSDAVQNQVASDQKLGTRLRIQSTPTFYLNGTKLQNPQGLEPFKALVQEALDRASK